VSTAGVKAWTVRYRLPDGKQPAPATIGYYPALSLAGARVRAVEAQRDAKQGRMTAGVRKARQVVAAASDAEQEAEMQAWNETQHASFLAVSGRWLAEKRLGWGTESYRKARLVVDSYLVPALGTNDMRTLETKDVRPTLVSMAARTPALAKKARQYVAGIVEHAINDGLRSDESMLRLNRILPTSHSGHMPSVTEDEARLGEIMRAIDGYSGSVVRAALTLTALTVVRPGVAAAARWADMHLKSGEWKIPADVMKTRQPFTTSLPQQVLEVLREMHEHRGDNEYVFPPQARQKSPHLHRDSLSKALRELGFQGEHSAHGFRASFRTLGRERLNVDVDVLEAQLAHAPKDEVAAAYARVKFKDKRREVMQAWADYLDGLRSGSKVVPIRRKAG
jgi:integrase